MHKWSCRLLVKTTSQRSLLNRSLSGCNIFTKKNTPDCLINSLVKRSAVASRRNPLLREYYWTTDGVKASSYRSYSSKQSNWFSKITAIVPFTMKLDTPQFKALFTPEVNRLIEIFSKYDYELRIAGGPVRDLLMNKDCHDMDFATTATPDEMKTMFEKEGIRMINMKGEKHGTITCRINDKVSLSMI